jgi:hypothetical protein
MNTGKTPVVAVTAAFMVVETLRGEVEEETLTGA